MVLHGSLGGSAPIATETTRSCHTTKLWPFCTSSDRSPTRPQGFEAHGCIKTAGPLPEAWGAAGVLPSLQSLVLDGNRLSGSLPQSWGAAGSFGEHLHRDSGLHSQHFVDDGTQRARWHRRHSEGARIQLAQRLQLGLCLSAMARSATPTKVPDQH